MGDINRNQDFTKAFLGHANFLNMLAIVEDMDALCVYNPPIGVFDIHDQSTLERIMYTFMLSCSKKSITMSSVRDVIEQVKQIAPRRYVSAESNVIALTDCLIDMRTFEKYDFSIDRHAFFNLPFSSQALTEPTTTFEQSRFKLFLDQVLITDKGTPDLELQALMQEMFGYTLLQGSSVEASFFLVGEGSNGKSVLLHLLENIIGEKWCSNLSIEQMTNSEHATTALVGKRLNICTEEESQFVKSDKFKSLVSGEPTTINYKFGKITRARLPVKYIYATNELPTFSGFNHGLLRRIKIIPFKRTFTDAEQDRTLFEKLLPELPLITAWAFQGAKRLVENGYKLSHSEASETSKGDFESILSSAVSFIRDEYTEKLGEFAYHSDLYTHYTQWCTEVGKKQMSKQNFIRDIGRVLTIPTETQWNKNTSKAERGRALIRTKDSLRIQTIQGELPTF